MKSLQTKKSWDAVVVGSGPNGLSAAIALAEMGKKTLLREAMPEIGGASKCGELTLPGFKHDLGSAIHPMALSSPYFSTLPLERYGLEWIHPPIPLAHPLDGGTAAVLCHSIEETAGKLGRDEKKYRTFFNYFTENHDHLISDLLAPLGIPSHPFLFARFGLSALLPADWFIRFNFKEETTRALFAGLAAHSFLKFSTPTSAAIGIVLALAGHKNGWPLPKGGSSALSRALAHYFIELGGVIETNAPVHSLDHLPTAHGYFFDLNPSQILKLGGDQLPKSYQRSLRRFKPGPGVFKLDWALSSPIPWSAQECRLAGTIHLGGSYREIQESEDVHWNQEASPRPFVLLAQPTLFDPSRAPEGRHIGWAYCHVPYGWTGDMTKEIEDQVERFAPGFKSCILARAKSFPSDLELQNPNLRGGDISGGAPIPSQLFFRPALKWNPYSIPGLKNSWICSSSSPPGAGVHGMCGFHAVKSATKSLTKMLGG